MIDKRRKSPLAHRKSLSAPDNSISLREGAFCGKFILRISPVDDVVQALNLPIKPNRICEWEGADILWLGPDEWMFVTPPDVELGGKLTGILAGRHHQLTDVTDYYTIIQIAGANASDTLMKLTMFDLHARAFKRGDVAGTMFAKTAAWIVNRSQDAPEFEIIVRWSMADYLWCLIAESAREFGMQAQSPTGQEKGLQYKAG